MQIDANGTLRFEDKYELVYELLSELEYEVKPDGSIYDPNSNNIIFFNGLKVIASIDQKNIHYAGQGEISFDILENIRMSTVLFGKYLEKKMAEGMPFISFYPEEKIVEGKHAKDPDIKLSNLTIKFDNVTEASTPFYCNKCLKFIYMIFYLEGNIVDLSNFDVWESK